jgi:hypothetical protein
MSSYFWEISGNASLVGDVTNAAVTVTVGAGCTNAFSLQLTLENANGCQSLCDMDVDVGDAAPEIVCPSEILAQCLESIPPAATNETEFVDLGGSISNACGGPYTVLSTDGALTNGVCGGTLTRTYRVSDACGHQSFCDQVIVVMDTTAPVVTWPSNVMVQCIEDLPVAATNLQEFLALGGADASDNCNGLLSVNAVDGNLISNACGGTITRVYTVSDFCGNIAESNQVITVDDTEPPVIGCLDPVVVPTLADVPPAATNLGIDRNKAGALAKPAVRANPSAASL